MKERVLIRFSLLKAVSTFPILCLYCRKITEHIVCWEDLGHHTGEFACPECDNRKPFQAVGPEMLP